jgi:hypothetical protein
MNNESTVQRLGAGAAAGLAGSVLIQGLLAASQKWAPQVLPPIKQDPGEFMVEKAEKLLPERVREKIPERLEKAAAKSLALGYGTTFGALYATSRPKVKSLLLEGSALGHVGCRLSRLAPGSRPDAAGRRARVSANCRPDTESHPLWNCDSGTVPAASSAPVRFRSRDSLPYLSKHDPSPLVGARMRSDQMAPAP